MEQLDEIVSMEAIATIKINWTLLLMNGLIVIGLSLILSMVYIVIFARPIIKWIFTRTMKRFMSNKYDENLWEVVSAMTRVSPNTVMENSLRSASGSLIARPFGSPKNFHHFEGLVFSPAQLSRLPLNVEEGVIDMKTTIGPSAKRPLTIDLPIMSGGMAYGIALSKKAKKAIAMATARAGTAANSGEGAYLPEERELASHFILQYTPGYWSKSPDILSQADAIEIQIGQGASAAATSTIPPEDLPGDIRELFHLAPEEDLFIPAAIEEIYEPDGLQKTVEKLRKTTDGIPIGVKLAASGELEVDVQIAIDANVDFISIDGGQAGSKGEPPILEDDFGLPTIYALVRAAEYLKESDVQHQISLLVGGGMTTPGECLKAIALGADAVYMGTSLIWAMAHDQVTKSLPWEPPTSLVFYAKNKAEEFDEEKAAHHLENFFLSYSKEMETAIQSLGKKSIQAVNKTDLVALDASTSDITKVPLGYEQKKE